MEMYNFVDRLLEWVYVYSIDFFIMPMQSDFRTSSGYFSSYLIVENFLATAPTPLHFTRLQKSIRSRSTQTCASFYALCAMGKI